MFTPAQSLTSGSRIKRRLPPFSASIESIERPICLRIRVGRGRNPLSHDMWRLTLDDAAGRGFVSVAGPDWSGSYFWPRWSRGDDSLLDFLTGADVGYVGGKLNADGDFDDRRTQRAIRSALFLRHRKETKMGRGLFGKREPVPIQTETGRDYSYAAAYEAVGDITSMEAWTYWIIHYAPCGDFANYEEFPTWTRIRPDFERFYRAAWPVLRKRRAELDALLYPNGYPKKES